MANTTTYTDEEIAHALAALRANRGNAKKTATQLGIPRTTLRQWAGLSPVKGKQVPLAKVEAASAELATTFEKISGRITEKVLEAVERVELKNAQDIRNMLVGAGITTDKGQLLRGGATSRVESVRVSLMEPSELRDRSLRVIEGGRKAVQKAG